MDPSAVPWMINVEICESSVPGSAKVIPVNPNKTIREFLDIIRDLCESSFPDDYELCNHNGARFIPKLKVCETLKDDATVFVIPPGEKFPRRASRFPNAPIRRGYSASDFAATALQHDRRLSRGAEYLPERAHIDSAGRDRRRARTPSPDMPAALEQACSPLRAYQKEVACRLWRNNYILYMPPGSGKTKVAAAIVKAKLLEDKQNKGIFLVDRLEFLDHEFRRLEEELEGFRVGKYLAQNYLEWSQDVPQKDMMVLTLDVFYNFLTRTKSASLENFTLMIFDDCHYAVLEDSFKKLMAEYYYPAKQEEARQIPKIIGLTSHPGAASSLEKTKENIRELCTQLDARITRVRHSQNKTELQKHISVPEVKVIEIDATDAEEKFATGVKTLMDKLELYLADAGIRVEMDLFRGFQDYSDSVVKLKDVRRQKVEDHYDTAIDGLLTCNMALMLLYETGLCDASEYFTEQHQHLRTSAPTYTQDILVNWIKGSLLLEDIAALEGTDPSDCPNDKCRTLVDELKSFETSDDFRGIVFVNLVRSVDFVVSQLSGRSGLEFLKFKTVVGQVPPESDEYAEREQLLADFNAGICNLLVVQGISEENLAVSSCSVVIRYDGQSTTSLLQPLPREQSRFLCNKFVLIYQKPSPAEDQYQELLNKEKYTLRAIDELENEARGGWNTHGSPSSPPGHVASIPFPALTSPSTPRDGIESGTPPQTSLADTFGAMALHGQRADDTWSPRKPDEPRKYLYPGLTVLQRRHGCEPGAMQLQHPSPAHPFPPILPIPADPGSSSRPHSAPPFESRRPNYPSENDAFRSNYALPSPCNYMPQSEDDAYFKKISFLETYGHAMLKESLCRLGLPEPAYEVTETGPAHERMFEARFVLCVPGRLDPVELVSSDRRKKAAEKHVARDACLRLLDLGLLFSPQAVPRPPWAPPPSHSVISSQDPAQPMDEHAVRMKFFLEQGKHMLEYYHAVVYKDRPPHFEITESGPPHAKRYEARYVLVVTENVTVPEEIEFRGSHTTRLGAIKLAARDVCLKLEELAILRVPVTLKVPFPRRRRPADTA